MSIVLARTWGRSGKVVDTTTIIVWFEVPVASTCRSFETGLYRTICPERSLWYAILGAWAVGKPSFILASCRFLLVCLTFWLPFPLASCVVGFHARDGAAPPKKKAQNSGSVCAGSWSRTRVFSSKNGAAPSLYFRKRFVILRPKSKLILFQNLPLLYRRAKRLPLQRIPPHFHIRREGGGIIGRGVIRIRQSLQSEDTVAYSGRGHPPSIGLRPPAQPRPPGCRSKELFLILPNKTLDISICHLYIRPSNF